MKKIYVTVVMATAIAFASVAQEISFVETEYNFGVVTKGDSAIHRFVFTNTGNAPLILTGHTTSCGCTVPAYPKDTPILPGEGGSIAVRYNNTHNPVAFDKSVTISSNAKSQPNIKLTVKGDVVEKK
ncbi:hypothetical protein FACS189452_06830 [Bacteroidia bacterium]|nr:hypothetical protein FACS189452_06830 [Bacteroidia bacterium]GHT81154.1 hypothetical protein FACS189467_4710 [Bacteroidia bacterium]